MNQFDQIRRGELAFACDGTMVYLPLTSTAHSDVMREEQSERRCCCAWRNGDDGGRTNEPCDEWRCCEWATTGDGNLQQQLYALTERILCPQLQTCQWQAYLSRTTPLRRIPAVRSVRRVGKWTQSTVAASAQHRTRECQRRIHRCTSAMYRGGGGKGGCCKDSRVGSDTTDRR
jgi:hypothetical protein